MPLEAESVRSAVIDNGFVFVAVGGIHRISAAATRASDVLCALDLRGQRQVATRCRVLAVISRFAIHRALAAEDQLARDFLARGCSIVLVLVVSMLHLVIA